MVGTRRYAAVIGKVVGKSSHDWVEAIEAVTDTVAADFSGVGVIVQCIKVLDQQLEQVDVPSYWDKVDTFVVDNGLVDPVEAVEQAREALETVRSKLMSIPGVSRAYKEVK